MKPRVSVITLGVDDLDRALAFYRDGLGLESKGIVGDRLEPATPAGGLGIPTMKASH